MIKHDDMARGAETAVDACPVGAPIKVILEHDERAGTAIFDGKRELCGQARALWIEPRASVSELTPK